MPQEHKDGTVIYLHNMLEAKVLCANGMALSLMSEPIKNPAQGAYDKQDCETKAFQRLVARIKQSFPRQPFVHLLDSLYAQGPVFELLERAKHPFICGFKEGSTPTLYSEALELLALHPENKLAVKTQVSGKGGVHQSFRWLDNLEYKGMTLGFVLCKETDKEGEVTTYAWLTSFAVSEHTVQEIARAGRMRWKIENEGFNEQKNGYAMKHFCNCNDFNVMLCLYLLLQIAHMFMQLLAKSDLLDAPLQVPKTPRLLAPGEPAQPRLIHGHAKPAPAAHANPFCQSSALDPAVEKPRIVAPSNTSENSIPALCPVSPPTPRSVTRPGCHAVIWRA